MDLLEEELNKVLKEATLTSMRGCGGVYVGSSLRSPFSLDEYFRANHETINYLHDTGRLTDKDLDGLVEEKIIEEAHTYIRLMRKCNDSEPDGVHVLRSSFLAYALEKSALSDKEVRVIDFGKNKMAESYIKQFGRPDLVESVRKELLDPKPKPVPLYDEHPVCDSMH